MMNAKREEKYRLIIDGLQKCDGDSVENRLDTMAVCRNIRDKVYIFYDEYQEDGSVQKCRLIISPKEVELKKTGNGTSVLRFIENTRQECRYQSPMGELMLVSDTKKMLVKKNMAKNPPEILVELSYDLYMGGSLMSEYELSIRI